VAAKAGPTATDVAETELALVLSTQLKLTVVDSDVLACT
jgi:hypothetical protein